MDISVFVPGHITGFFNIENNVNPLKNGSCGAGFLVNRGVLTDISSSEKSGELSFRQLSNCSELYRITLRFPVDDYRREAVH